MVNKSKGNWARTNLTCPNPLPTAPPATPLPMPPYLFVPSDSAWETDASVVANSSQSPPAPVFPSDFPASPEVLGYVLFSSGLLLPFYTESQYYAFAGPGPSSIPGCLYDQPPSFFSNTGLPPCAEAEAVRHSLSSTEGSCCFVDYNSYHEDDDGNARMLPFEEHLRNARESQTKDAKARRWMCNLTTATAIKSTGGKAPRMQLASAPSAFSIQSTGGEAPRKQLASAPSAFSIARLWGVSDAAAFSFLVSSIPAPTAASGKMEYSYAGSGDVAFLEYSSSSSSAGGCTVHHVEVPESRRAALGGAPVGKALLCAFLLKFASSRSPLYPECTYAQHLLDKSDEKLRAFGVDVVEITKKRKHR